MEFRVDRKLSIRPNVRLPAEGMGILEGWEQVMRIYQAQAEGMLEWACGKKGGEAVLGLMFGRWL